MLESERAGAKALVVLLDDFPRKTEEWGVLRQVQAGEAHNCALIGKLLDGVGAPHSHATGEFYEKAIAMRGPRARIEFLVRGLRWAVRRFDEALPCLPAGARTVFAGIRDSHLRSIAACESIAGKIAAT